MSHPSPTIAVDAAGPVVIGVPFPEGQLSDPSSLAIVSQEGVHQLGSARNLVPWPDGSVRWALLSFIADATGTFAVVVDKAQAGFTEGQEQVKLTADESGTTLDNGHVAIALSGEGGGPIREIHASGKSLLACPADFQLCVGSASTAHEGSRAVTVLEDGPARVRARTEGAHYNSDGQRKMTYRLDVELWAGMPVVRLAYQFFQVEPGAEFLPVERMGMDLDLALGGEIERQFVQTNHGEFYRTRVVFNPDPVAIVTDTVRPSPHVEDPAMLSDDDEYASYLAAPLTKAPPWLGVTDGDTSAYLHVQDMAAMQPKRIASEGARLSFDVWPERAGPLQMQQGHSRRHVVTLTFADGEPLSRDSVESTMVLPLWEGRACVNPDWLAFCGEFEQDKLLKHRQHTRFEKWLTRLVRLDMLADMFDLGDTPDSGYQRSYSALGLQRQPRVPGAPAKPRVFGPETPHHSMVPWADMSDYEPVWTNNEYDAIHAFGSELMRTGRHDLWLHFRWQVRHNIEVDFTHYSDEKWLHRISRVHSAKHTTSGGYPSHFWTEGLMKYFCLTGDPDVLENAVAIGDAILRFFHDPERGKLYGNYDREMGWALLAMVHVWDITREPRFEAEAERLIQFFVDYHAEHSEAPIHSPAFLAAFYFMLNMIEAIDLFARRRDDRELGEWLVGILRPFPDAVRKIHSSGGTSRSTAPALAIGYERTGDVRFLEAGLPAIEELIEDSPDWQTPIHEAKPMAIRYREFIRFFGGAQKEGMLDQFEYESLKS